MNNQYGSFSIGHLHLSDRSHNALINAGICTIDDLVAYNSNELEQLRGIGQGGIDEIKRILNNYNYLSMKAEQFEWYEYHELCKIKPKRLFYYCRKLEAIPVESRELPICHLHLENRSNNSLSRVGINYIGELITAAHDGIDNNKELGIKTIVNVLESLKALSQSTIESGAINWHFYLNTLKSYPANLCITSETLENAPTCLLEKSIGFLHFSNVAYNSLARNNIVTIGDLIFRSKQGIQKIRGLVLKAISESIKNLIALSNSIVLPNEVDWFNFWNENGIILFPDKLDNVDDLRKAFLNFSNFVMELISSTFDERDWVIIQRRFGLNNTEILTLEELGEAYGLTRERVRQLEERVLLRLEKTLFQDDYTGIRIHIHPNFLNKIHKLRSKLAESEYRIFKGTDLFQLVKNNLGLDAKSSLPEISLLLTLMGMNSIKFDRNGLQEVWGLFSVEKANLIETIIIGIDDCLNGETSKALDELDLLVAINKKRPKQKKIKIDQLRRYLFLCDTVEETDSGVYRGKFEFLKYRHLNIERILSEIGQPTHFSEIVRILNNRLAQNGQKTCAQRNITNQMVNNDSFIPVGRSGQWALSSWDNIETRNISDLILHCFHSAGHPLSIDEIYNNIRSKRPVSKVSISMRIANNGEYKKVSRTHWGLKTWRGIKREATWSPEQVAAFIESIFIEKKTDHVDYKEIKEALIQATGFKERVVRGLLVNNPAIQVNVLDYKTRIASFQKNYKNILHTTNYRRNKPTQVDLINSHISEHLFDRENKESFLIDIVKHIESSFKFKRPSIYAAINQSDKLKKFTDSKGRKILKLISQDGILSFIQVNDIIDETIKNEAKKAISMLNINTVDVGLFQLGRLFENVLRRYMNTLMKDSSNNINQNNINNLNSMIAYIKKAGIITDETVLSVLRTERNLRAHGIAPDEKERRLLLNSAKWIVDRYLDYIIFFENKTK
jgi:DNA-directed RNA polymerase alpha subunit